MINTEDFILRLQDIIQYYNFSASAFADKIGVQRSSVSHILSGRNKPSLDFVMKILNQFNEVDLYWLLNGKGEFPKTEVLPPKKDQEEILTSPTLLRTEPSKSQARKDDDIERIVIFYKDGTFKDFKN